jgi:hypothetical protein
MVFWPQGAIHVFLKPGVEQRSPGEAMPPIILAEGF